MSPLARRVQRERAAQLVPDNPFEDTTVDRAKTLGLVGEAHRIAEDGSCEWCCDQSWRRARPVCHGCGLPYSAERITPREAPSMQSTLFRAEDFGW